MLKANPTSGKHFAWYIVTHEVRVIILRDGIVDLIVFILYITFGN